MKLSEVLSQEGTRVDVKINGESKFWLKFNQNTLTPALLSDLENVSTEGSTASAARSVEVLPRMLGTIVIDWNLEDDDGVKLPVGPKFPIQAIKTFNNLPIDLLVAISTAIFESTKPGEVLGAR